MFLRGVAGRRDGVLGSDEPILFNKSKILRRIDIQLKDVREARDEHAQDERSVIDAVQSNTQLLNKLLVELADVRTLVNATTNEVHGEGIDERKTLKQSQRECHRLRETVLEFEAAHAELQSQNEELASRIANSRVQETTPKDSQEASEILPWEERKRLILQQMEEDSFDADQFASSLESEIQTSKETPSAFIERLRSEIECRDQEIVELRNLLDQQSEPRSDGIAIGASAIADTLDADALIQLEREKLKKLQVDWEEKFREGEIEASLERAKLSRDRQEVLEKKAELELQLEHLKREYRQSSAANGGTSRRWLAKLGLADDEA